jgi:hypothetical protein
MWTSENHTQVHTAGKEIVGPPHGFRCGFLQCAFERCAQGQIDHVLWQMTLEIKSWSLRSCPKRSPPLVFHVPAIAFTPPLGPKHQDSCE